MTTTQPLDRSRMASSGTRRRRASTVDPSISLSQAQRRSSAAPVLSIPTQGGGWSRPRLKEHDDTPVDEDPLGEALTNIINRHPSFHSRRRVAADDKTRFRFTPLLSRHNLEVLKHRLLGRNFSWMDLPGNALQFLRSIPSFVVCDPRPSSKEVFSLFGTLVALCLVATTVFSSIVTVVVSSAVVYGSGLVIVLLIDWEDLQKHCPASLRSIWTWLRRTAAYIDAHAFLGLRFAGREWDTYDFVWKPDDDAESLTSSLLDVPPPTVRFGRRLCLDKDFLARKEWSRETVNHVVAIDYCYVMLREENLRKLASKRRRNGEADAVVTEQVDWSRTAESETGVSNVLDSVQDGDKDSYNEDPSKITVISTNTRRSVVMNGGAFPASSPAEAIELKVSQPTDSVTRNLGALDDSLRASRVLSDDSDDDRRSDVSVNSNASDVAGDLPWIDVGAKIGMRLLNSAHLQRAMASQQETTDRLIGSLGTDSGGMSPVRRTSVVGAPSEDGSRYTDTPDGRHLAKPIHSMWTSPAAVGSTISAKSSEMDDLSIVSGQSVSATSHPGRALSPPRPSLPPLSPKRNRKAIQNSPKPIPAKLPVRDAIEDNLTPPRLQRVRLPHEDSFVLSPNSPGDPFESGSSTTQRLPMRSTSTLSHVTGNVVHRREVLMPGVKVAVPMVPLQPTDRSVTRRVSWVQYQMATVVSSTRIVVTGEDQTPVFGSSSTNCLSVTVKLDKSFLRNGDFAELTFRVMDAWSSRYMPRHSKLPIGSCVATAYGIGVLVGWRVEDDCHVVRSLWQRRGAGSGHAYLNRDAIVSTIEAAVGFRVKTNFGWGNVIAAVDCSGAYDVARFFVAIKDEGRHKGHVLELNRGDIISCHGAQFIPVIEHVREAAKYQIQVDNYKAALSESQLEDGAPSPEQQLWRSFSDCLEILWKSFLQAVDEDKEFDEGVNEFMTSIINFLEQLDKPESEEKETENCDDALRSESISTSADEDDSPARKDLNTSDDVQDPGFWIVNDFFGGIFKAPEKKQVEDEETRPPPKQSDSPQATGGSRSNYDRIFAVLRTLMRTVSIARAASVDNAHFRLALAIGYDFLLFVRTVIKVQQKNLSKPSQAVWKRAWQEITTTFGPMKDRLTKIGQGIAQRMEAQGRKAKVRVLKFVDIVLGDEKLLNALEQGEWDHCLRRLEFALVAAKVIEEENLIYYRKTAAFIHDHLQLAISKDGGAAARNNEKLALLAHVLQSVATPRRSLLKLFNRDEVLELFERILVRAYYKEDMATRMLTIHASNFHSLRHLRLLKDFSVAGRMWIPLLDAADEEFSWVVSHLPENTKDYMCPVSSLFSLCVAQFHKINAGDLSKDWLAFLLEEESVRIIQDIDMRLILALESFSQDCRDMMVVLPYYASIDDDILNLMDEVDLDKFLKEASEAMDDQEKLSQFVREKATIAVERFLNYLPKMSIPVEKRDLMDGWVLTCRGEDGGDLTLSDVNINRENLVCQIMGGDALFFPMFCDEDDDASVGSAPVSPARAETAKGFIEESVLDHIREMIQGAVRHGCWKSGVGGVGQPPTDRYVASVLQGLPVSAVLNCGIELWRNLEIDDDELLEIAIRDVSYQIELHSERETGDIDEDDLCLGASSTDSSQQGRKPSRGPSDLNASSSSSSFESVRRRFNPRVDPTVLFLEIKNLKLQLDKFFFRIEKNEKRTIFDPVFEGRGMVSLQNVSIRLRVEVAKERVRTTGLGVDVSAPVLHLRELEVSLDEVKLKVKDTGFGSDWVLNQAVTAFAENITKVVEANLRDQIHEQVKVAIENLNSYFVLNPKMLLNLLGISMEDLDENVVWV